MGKEFFDLLGLGVPFYLAAATYAVFAWLDNNASDEATKVISSWLHGRSHNKLDLGNLIINAFDRIYTSPLLTLRAFRRSAAISTSAWLLLYLVPLIFSQLWNRGEDWNKLINFRGMQLLPLLFTGLVVAFFLIVLTDYISLFFVRRFLWLAQAYPIRASTISSIIGLIVVALSYCVFLVLALLTMYYLVPYVSNFCLDPFSMYDIVGKIKPVTQPMLLAGFIVIMRPAFIIHLWLPLFALSSLIVQLIFWIFRAVEWAQWFLKQGDAHPLKAIGIVATIIVFGSAMLVKEGWALLGVLERS